MTLKSNIVNDVIKKINPHMHKLGPRGPTHYVFGE